MKKADRTTLFLLVYLVGIAIYAYPNYKESGEWGEFVAIIGGSLLIFALLRYVLMKRDEFRNKRREES